MLRLIAAIDEMRGVANEHGIPWQGKIPMDTNRYHELTSNGIIMMGYGTYEEYDTPLHDRDNYVVTHRDSGALRTGFIGIPDADEFFDHHVDELVWVIGGAALFSSSLARADQLFLTQLDGDFHCTKFFPAFADGFEVDSDQGPLVENGITFHFQEWQRLSASES
jgi:dihydrofolate reductase